jgi:uncharacterized membrane protein
LDEILNLLLRWAHVFAGILWIGQTWLFLWLDYRFEDAMENPGGRVYLVHSGGFYVVEKQRALGAMPTTLHWFKWEAALTWLTGMGLLLLVYYRGELLVTADASVSSGRAAALGPGLLLLAWLVYDQLWLRAEGRGEAMAAAISYALVVAASFGLTRVMSGRSAWMHVGSLLGTLMAANVWMRIIPGQRAMVAATAEGRPPDVSLGDRAKQRSKHNTFIVVPLVLIMLSNHFPTLTYGHQHSAWVLAVVLLVGAGLATILRRR